MNVNYTTYARFAEVFGKDGNLTLEDTTTLGEALQTLCGTDQTKRGMLFDADGSVRKYVILMVNRERITADELDLALHDGDEIVLYPPVSGG